MEVNRTAKIHERALLHKGMLHFLAQVGLSLIGTP